MNKDQFTEQLISVKMMEIENLEKEIEDIKSANLSISLHQLMQVMKWVECCPHDQGCEKLEDIRTYIPDALSWYKPKEFSRLMKSLGFSRSQVKTTDSGWSLRWNIRLIGSD